MSKKDYVEVGAIMTRKNGKKYEAVEDVMCEGCAFYSKGSLFCRPIVCKSHERPDATCVVFIRRKDLES